MLCDVEAGGPQHPGPWPTVCSRESRGCPERRGRCRDADAAGDVVGCEKNPADVLTLRLSHSFVREFLRMCRFGFEDCPGIDVRGEGREVGGFELLPCLQLMMFGGVDDRF